MEACPAQRNAETATEFSSPVDVSTIGASMSSEQLTVARPSSPSVRSLVNVLARRRVRLLAVDDDKMNLEMIELVLLDKKTVRAGWVFEIATADDGVEAVQILTAAAYSSSAFDVVLMDE